MRVFKFGGASVKDSDGVRNIASLLITTSYSDVFMVVSAMGKTTNAMEDVIRLYFSDGDYQSRLDEVKDWHLDIINELFENPVEISKSVSDTFEDTKSFLIKNKSPHYDFVYDQTVSCGEFVSTKIVSEYLNSVGIINNWLDVRNLIKTDQTYREGKVNWELTQKKFEELDKNRFYVTQGFLGSDPNYFTTTLGREGSDYTAAIIAYCISADSLTIWKDVPGVLNGDPRYFEDTVLLHKMSYEEAIELAYYGASVIHPKTIRPLLEKGIHFYVKSFLNPMEKGTEIFNGADLDPKVSCYIVKKNQNLVTLTTSDSSFMSEDKFSEVFGLLHELKIKVNLMQNSAITFSLCLEDKFNRLDELKKKLTPSYKVEIEKNVSLYTIRHFEENSAYTFDRRKELLRQVIKNTLQIIVKEE